MSKGNMNLGLWLCVAFMLFFAISLMAGNADASKVFGKIQVVDSFPDYKVRIVNSFPSLKVQVADGKIATRLQNPVRQDR